MAAEGMVMGDGVWIAIVAAIAGWFGKDGFGALMNHMGRGSQQQQDIMQQILDAERKLLADERQEYAVLKARMQSQIETLQGSVDKLRGELSKMIAKNYILEAKVATNDSDDSK
jgi:hypothetical protein